MHVTLVEINVHEDKVDEFIEVFRQNHLGHSQDRQRIRYSPAALWQAAPSPDAIVQRQSADIKRGSSQTYFYSRQRVTPSVDKTDKFASRHQSIEQTFFTRPGH
jgi:hypothetical protein